MQHLHGLDLADVLRYRLSPRRVIWLCEHLPDDSATVAAMRGGPEHRGWTMQTYLQAAMFDRLGSVWMAIAAQHAKRRPKAPEPWPRPKVRRTRRPRVIKVGQIVSQPL